MTGVISRICIGTTLLLAVAVGGQARAAEPAPPSPSPAPLLAPPTLHHHITARATFVSGYPDLKSFSLSLAAFKPFDFELGVFVPPGDCCTERRGLYARAGVRRFVIDVRNPRGLGGVWHFQMMGGYRQLTARPIDAADGSGLESRYDGLTANVGVDAVRWLTPRFGLNANLTVGGIWWIHRAGESIGPVAPDLRVAIGIAL